MFRLQLENNLPDSLCKLHWNCYIISLHMILYTSKFPFLTSILTTSSINNFSVQTLNMFLLRLLVCLKEGNFTDILHHRH